MNNSFKIVIPFYNAENFVEKSVLSALTQRYENFKIILINDCSSDSSHERLQSLLSEFQDKIVYIKNDKRMGAMYNHQMAVFEHCEKDDIVVQLDGDDWFVNKNVLSYINDFYNNSNCWMMYGQAQYLSGRRGNAKEYNSIEEFNNKRNVFDFYISHVRTFRAFLFHDIKRQDPELKCFKDNNGDWYSMTCDVAMMYPLMEICGYEKMKYNDKVLYIYNDSNPIQDFKIDLHLQESIHREILRKEPFKQIENEKHI